MQQGFTTPLQQQKRMNSFTCQLSDTIQQPFASFSSVGKAESSSLSETSGVMIRCSTHSDEELKMARSRPKNRSGRRVFKETRHPVYHGVRNRNNKWVSEIREPNKKTRIWLGTHPTAEMAARAHDVAACALRGKQACLNFVDSAWPLPVPASNDHLDIRRAAAEAAEAFRPEECGGFLKSLVDNEKEHESETVVMDNEIDSLYERVHENERVVMDSENMNDSLYEDEEALLNMPGLLTSMAEGLLLSPPHYHLDTVNDADHDMDTEASFSLWSF